MPTWSKTASGRVKLAYLKVSHAWLVVHICEATTGGLRSSQRLVAIILIESSMETCRCRITQLDERTNKYRLNLFYETWSCVCYVVMLKTEIFLIHYSKRCLELA